MSKEIVTTKLRFETEQQRNQLKQIAKKKRQSGNSVLLTLIEKEYKRLFKC